MGSTAQVGLEVEPQGNLDERIRAAGAVVLGVAQGAVVYVPMPTAASASESFVFDRPSLLRRDLLSQNSAGPLVRCKSKISRHPRHAEISLK